MLRIIHKAFFIVLFGVAGFCIGYLVEGNSTAAITCGTVGAVVFFLGMEMAI